MADADIIVTEPKDPAPRPRSPLRRIGRWAAIGAAAILALLIAVYFGLNTQFGRRYVVDQINNLEMASGLDIDIQSIDGSLYGELTIKGLTLKDTKGTFFVAPEAKLDWRPFAYFRNHIDVRNLDIPAARLFRLPELNPSQDTGGPLLPDIDIDVGGLRVQRLIIDPAVTGRRHIMSLSGYARIDDGRAQIAADAAAIAAPGLPGGDRLNLRLDAVPEANRLDIAARLRGPANGMVAQMTGISKPFNLVVSGNGSWSAWRGKAQASLGGQALANLVINGRDGRFTIDGPVRPNLVLTGPAAALTGPYVTLNGVAAFEERRADLRIKLRSQALAAAMEGLVDLGQNRFDNLRIAARLLQPRAILPNLSGRDVQLALVLNGAFATPRVAYDLRAATLGFDDTIVEGLRARGAARVDADRIVVPIVAQARRVSGLNEAVGGLLTNVRVNGTLAMQGQSILSDDLRIRSDRLNATAVVVANLARGEYRAGLQGRINNYAIRGIGILDIDSDLDVVSRSNGFGVEGRVAIRTRRIDNSTARDFLGGNAVGGANIRLEPDGTIRFDRVRLAAPKLRITSASGYYRPDGRLDVRGSAVSTDYGPLDLRVTGSARAPQVSLRARSPGFGVGLRDVVAEVRSTAQGYQLNAHGESDYGPFLADVIILSGRGPLAVQVNLVRVAGVEARGRVTQTAAGPFAGTLSFAGSGLNGIARLSAQGSNQRVDVNARANGATIPGTNPIIIQRAIIQATAVLYPGAPSIVANAEMAGVRSGTLSMERARARINYQNGSGRAQIVAQGSSGVPFQVAVNAAMTPERIRAAAQGTINRVSFRLAQPADIRKIDGGWQLAPVTIVFPQGNVRIAGRLGDGGTVIQSRFNGLDLSILNAFFPNLGVGGSMAGSLDFAQPSGDSFPRADARLTIQNFTRTGIAIRSTPVTVALVGSLRPEGGTAAAVIRRQGAVVGRAQARLQPLSPAAGSWTTRLLASPLSGGIRYNGPAEALWSLTGIADQHLSGPIGIAADFSGRVQNPQFTGVIRSKTLRFEDETLGTRITDIAMQGRFSSSTLEIQQLSGRAGSGSISGQGRVDLSANAGFPIDIRLALANAQLARSDSIAATVSGNIAITNNRQSGARISGNLELPEARYQIVNQGGDKVVELDGVRFKGQPLPRADQVNRKDDTAPSIWNLDLRINADNGVYVSGMGLDSEWEADLRVTGTTSAPIITGSADVIRGDFSFAGNRFELRNGVIGFEGGRQIDPSLNIQAVGEVDEVEITINVTGRALDPQISFSSSPALPQDEIMSRLLFGGPINQLSALQVVQIGASLNALRGGGGGLNPLGKLESASGLSNLRILGADEATGRGTAISAGFYLSNDIYLELITDARGFTATQIEVALSKTLSVLSQAGSTGGTIVNLRYSKDY